MKIKELKKEYERSLKDFNRKDTPEQKQKFKEDCLQWFVEYYGIGSEQVRETIEALAEL